MDMHHTKEEIDHFDRRDKLRYELEKLLGQHNDQFLIDGIASIKQEIATELAKYDHMIGTEYYAPPSFMNTDRSYRKGKITEITHFNAYSNSVRCRFQYDHSIGGGHDGHAIRELKITI